MFGPVGQAADQPALDDPVILLEARLLQGQGGPLERSDKRVAEGLEVHISRTEVRTDGLLVDTFTGMGGSIHVGFFGAGKRPDLQGVNIRLVTGATGVLNVL